MDDLDDEIFEKPSKFDIVMRMEWSLLYHCMLPICCIVYGIPRTFLLNGFRFPFSICFFTSDIVELVQAYTH